ncbi:MAG TPA: hypothetical protein VL461_12610 [Dictyobacter sp.]|jgi:hypothetical protein|nr:hypothetical protein [Dictyobacter sp.]
MPKQVFALDATATHRITVHWTNEINPVTKGLDPATVLINGTILGSLNPGEEMTVGKDFILPDNSPLHVQFFNGQPQAFRMGVPLAPVADAADVADTLPANRRKRGGCLTAWLIFNLVVIVVFTLLYFLGALGSLSGETQSSLALGYFLLGVVGVVGIVGISILLAWKKLGFYLLAGFVVANIVISVAIGQADVRTFIPLFTIGSLFVWLNRSGVWENLK